MRYAEASLTAIQLLPVVRLAPDLSADHAVSEWSEGSASALPRHPGVQMPVPLLADLSLSLKEYSVAARSAPLWIGGRRALTENDMLQSSVACRVCWLAPAPERCISLATRTDVVPKKR